MIIDEFNSDSLQKALKNLPLGGILFYPQCTSTNDLALNWAAKDAQDLSLVVTNHQTKGRGRKNRQWISSKDSSLTFSLILIPTMDESHNYGFYTALGALAVINSIKQINDKVEPKIKWPNDILINDKKVSGVLIEASWIGSAIEKVVLGIGINITKEAVPHPDLVSYPATSLEDVLPKPINRAELLYKIINEIIELRKTIDTSKVIAAWEENLAFRGSSVEVWEDEHQTRRGILTGLTQDGALRLLDAENKESIIHFGEMHLRPALLKHASSEENMV
ncbi:biotin--[acetyl-CoA-carboxylase] ligase [Chloroflexota bacterium]